MVRIFSRTPLFRFRRKHREGVGADSRYSAFATPLPLVCSLFNFSESDERHSCFYSTAKGTAYLSAMRIGIAYWAQSLSQLSACSRSARPSPPPAVGRNG